MGVAVVGFKRDLTFVCVCVEDVLSKTMGLQNGSLVAVDASEFGKRSG